MTTMSLNELVERLTQPAVRWRTGLWLVPDKLVGKESEIILNLPYHCDSINLGEAILKRQPANAKFARINPENIQAWIDRVLEEDATCKSVILTHLDLLLAAIGGPERDQIWEVLMNSFVRRSRALILAFPRRAVGVLLKPETVDIWRENQRLSE